MSHFSAVHVTLYANNHAVIAINKEKRQIQYRSYNTVPVSEIYHLGVLGYPAICSGKHYWEVDVSRKKTWILGLNDGLCVQPQLHSISEMGFKVKYNSSVKQRGNYQRKYGYWVIGMRYKVVYKAFDECSITHNSSILVISLPDCPSRVGVFLDRKAGTLSFYNISNNGTLIYRFCTASFPDRVFPYFNPTGSSEPMTICWPDS